MPNINEISRDIYLNSLEESDRNGQAFEALEQEEAEDVIETKRLHFEESLTHNRMHIIKTK